MTASDLRCDSCGSTYCVPESVASDAFERERLLHWVSNHGCIPVEEKK